MLKGKTGFVFPVSATNAILRTGKSDHSLRKLVYDFFTVASQMEEMRRYLGKKVGLTGPQYFLVMAVAELQGKTGVSVGRVAAYLHVTGTFVTTESGKLFKKGILEKRTDPRDNRRSLLSISEKGQRALSALFPELRHINDIVFDLDSRDDFLRLCALMDRLVSNGQRALALINAARQDSTLMLNGAGVGVFHER